MYRYIGSAYAGSACLVREPAAIRAELCELEEELHRTEERMKDATRRKEEVHRCLQAGKHPSDPTLLATLDEIVFECDEIHDTMLSLCDRVDTLAEELCEAIYRLRGMRAC